MTLIIRAPGRITSPLPGSFDPPKLGVTGIVSRFMSVGAAPNPGDSIATLKDLVGGHDVSLTAGVVTYEDLGGIPVVSLAAAGRNTMTSSLFSGIPKARSIALLAYFSASAPATETLVGTLFPAWATVSMAAGGNIAGWGGDGSFFSAPASPKPGWFKIVVSYAADGVGKIAVNGVITNGAFGYATSQTNSIITITAPSSIGMKIVDLAIINHAVTDAEIASITAGLGEWLP